MFKPFMFWVLNLFSVWSLAFRIYFFSSPSAHSCIIFFNRIARLGLFRSRSINTGQPSSIEFSAAEASPDSNWFIPSSSMPGGPEILALGPSCLRRSSSVTRTGSTQFLYQGQVLHCTNDCASSRISAIYLIPAGCPACANSI